MQLSVRTQVIIGSVSLLCVLLVGGTFVLLRNIGPGPASQLPAGRTVMLVSNISPQMQRQMQGMLPALGDAPLQEQGTRTAALVRSGAGQTWVVFDESGTLQGHPPVLTEGETPLSSDAAFRQLRQTYRDHAPWLFVRFPETPLHIEGMRNPSVPMSMSVGTGSVHISWPTQMNTGFTGPVSPEVNGTIVHVRATRFASLLKDAASLLTAQNRLTAETLLTAWIARTAGTDVSARYDVLNLLDGPTTLTVTQTGSSTKIGVRALPHDVADVSIARIEQGMQSVGAGTERIQRTFDDTFTFDTVRMAEGGQAERMQMGGWDVVLSPAGMVGRMGREWAFGTDRGLFMSLLQAMQSSAGQHIAEGTIDPVALDILLSRWQIRLDLPWELLPAGKQVEWALDRKGGLAVLTIER